MLTRSASRIADGRENPAYTPLSSGPLLFDGMIMQAGVGTMHRQISSLSMILPFEIDRRMHDIAWRFRAEVTDIDGNST